MRLEQQIGRVLAVMLGEEREAPEEAASAEESDVAEADHDGTDAHSDGSRGDREPSEPGEGDDR
jgi:hypothetical protein